MTWEPDEKVDGAGLTLADHVKVIAQRLNLTTDQREVLVSELRNALVPAAGYLRVMSKTSPIVPSGLRGVERILALADAIAHQAPVVAEQQERAAREFLKELATIPCTWGCHDITNLCDNCKARHVLGLDPFPWRKS